ncbi:MAG: hypothetical protein JRJ84_13620 [Deltaproteobacteria bacterium]|nr:hypothetical protein [Deltaproteobacteria bacterium]
MHLAPTILAVVLLAAGCVEYAVTEYETTDVFHQNPWEKVDVLLVVDNSCSMEPYQDKLATDFGGFFDFFADGEVDWRLGVVLTDPIDPDFGYIRGPIVTPDVPDPEALFAEVVHVGTGGFGIEMGLESARLALSGYNHGFPRDDASVSLIFVSDEQDTSPNTVATYVDAYYEVKGHRARDAFNASALTVTSIADCTPEQYMASTPGTRYIEAAERTGGVVANLCLEDFAPIVVDLALTTSAMRDTYYLSRRPNLDTLEVLVEEDPVSCIDGAWTYSRVLQDGVERPAIIFDAEHLPPAGARIVAQYINGSGSPDGYCKDSPQ